MIRILFILPCLLAFNVTAQEVFVEYPYNPDSTSDQVIGTEDLLDFLPTFGFEFEPNSLEVNGVSLALYLQALNETISVLEAKVEALEAAEDSSSSFDGTYGSLTGTPALFDGNYSSLTGAPSLSDVATTGSYDDLIDQLTREDIVKMAHHFDAYYPDEDDPEFNPFIPPIGLQLSGFNLPGIAFRGATFKNADFSGAGLNNADFTDTQFISTSFENANLTNADFTGAVLNNGHSTEPNGGANFSNANLTGVIWPANGLGGCTFWGMDLSGTDWSGFNLVMTSLAYSDLSNANLSNANLTWSYLREANFTGANLSGADLTYANLEGVDFTNADLSNAFFNGIGYNGEPASWTGAYILNCAFCNCTDANNDNYCD